MDARTIETRLREITGGADMIPLTGIMKYTGTSRDWVQSRLREKGIGAIGTGHGQRYHVRDIAKVLAT